MDTTNLLLFTVGIIIGSGLSFAALSSRAYDKRFKKEIDAERARAARA